MKSQNRKPRRKYKPGSGGARPGAGAKKKVFDWEEFEKLCGIQSTLMEMCAWFDCDDVTLERAVKEHYGMPFEEVFKRKRGRGKVSLRRRQFQAALDGEIAMLIFLGKQYLDQADKKEVTGAWKNPYANMTDEELRIEHERLKQIEAFKDSQNQLPEPKDVIELVPVDAKTGTNE